MNRHVLVSLLKSFVLLDEVKVLSPDHYRPVHLQFKHHPRQDTTSNADVTSKRTFLVNVSAINGL